MRVQAGVITARQNPAGWVTLDRTWAHRLGAHLAKGVRRVGSFYRLPRAEYLRLINSQPGHGLRTHIDPAMSWTCSDDLEVAKMLSTAAREDQAGRKESDCVGCH